MMARDFSGGISVDQAGPGPIEAARDVQAIVKSPWTRRLISIAWAVAIGSARGHEVIEFVREIFDKVPLRLIAIIKRIETEFG